MTIGAEFVGISISSGLTQAWIDTYQNALNANPHVKYFDGRNGGYVRCDLNSERFHADFLLANSVNDRLSPVRTVASFEVYSEADPNLRKGAVLTYKESSEQEKYCVPSWARDWYVDGTPNEEMWWYFWWYKWCYTTTDGWYKVYDSWKWWGPVEQPALEHAEMGSRTAG